MKALKDYLDLIADYIFEIDNAYCISSENIAMFTKIHSFKTNRSTITALIITHENTHYAALHVMIDDCEEEIKVFKETFRTKLEAKRFAYHKAENYWE